MVMVRLYRRKTRRARNWPSVPSRGSQAREICPRKLQISPASGPRATTLAMQVLLRILLAIAAPPSTVDVDGLRHGAAEALHRLSDACRLHERARALPDVESPDLTDQLVGAALEEQTQRVPAALIVAIAWGESRFDRAARPACGVMQVYPNDLEEPAAACVAWRRDLRAGVRAGVKEIEIMLADKRVRGDMRRALLYRACGNKAFDGTCSVPKHAWVKATMERWRALAPSRRSTTAGS
jgi:hypothetical protein